MRLRIALGALGIALGLFGVFRLVTGVAALDLLMLVVWLGGALLIHDGLLSPLILGVGAVTRALPRRARAFVQGGLVSAGLITVVALPMIYRAHTQPAQKALLEQNFGRNLTVLLSLVLAASLALYAARTARDAVNATNPRPPDDQTSSSE